jgi:branched-chain amino acid transport system permease protein
VFDALSRRRTGERRAFGLRSRLWRVAALIVLIVLPQYLGSFWLQAGLFAMAAIIGAIGLTLLVGITGQLSLGHAFFIAVGAYGYSYLAGHAVHVGAQSTSGLGLPPLLAMIGAVALAGLAGALFSPISGRLRGIYLGIASLGLVFLGQHILFNAEGITGGFNGRDAEPFSVAGFHFADTHPSLIVFGVDYGQLERLWYLGLVLVAVAYWYARNLVGSRPGRGLQSVRDSEVAAAVMGVDVPRYKAAAFTISSMYAGLAGVLLALIFERVVPNTFDFGMSIDYLAMIVLGGLGSIGGAVIGAIFVTLLPQIFDHYSDALPLVSAPGGSLEPSEAARFLYGAAVVAVLVFFPGGLASLGQRPRPRRPRIRKSPLPTAPSHST